HCVLVIVCRVVALLSRSSCSSLFPYTTLFRSSGWELAWLTRSRAHLVIEGGREILVGMDPDHLAAQAGGDAHGLGVLLVPEQGQDRKSTRLNSSHGSISYAVFCLKKKNKSMTE